MSYWNDPLGPGDPFKLPPPCVRMACEDPADCMNGPEPHEFICSIDDDPLHGSTLPCVKQSWEYEAILWGPPQDRLHSCAGAT